MTHSHGMTNFLYRLGRASARRRRLVTVLWVAFALAAVIGGKALGGESSHDFSVAGVESQRTLDVLRERFPSQAGPSAQVVFAATSGSLTDPAVAATVDATLAEIAAQPDVV